MGEANKSSKNSNRTKKNILHKGVKNFVNSFSSVSLIRILEYTCINVLHKYEDLFVERINHIQSENRRSGRVSQTFSWVNIQYNANKNYIKSDLEKFSPDKYLSNKYAEAGEILAYKD